MDDARLGILMVEDERQVSRAISRTLRAHGFDVVAAPTAAMARVLECQFHLGIFDIDLGDGSGIDLARELIENGAVESAVFFSASLDPAALARAAEVGPVIAKREGVAALIPVVAEAIPLSAQRVSAVVPKADADTIPGPESMPDLRALMAARRQVG